MPFIDCKITKKLTDDQKTAITHALGAKINILHKPESYLMVGVCDGYDLYFAGKKLENGAYVEISLFGGLSSSDCNKMTAEVCRILNAQLNTDPSHVYVTYHGVNDWGWNGSDF